MLLLSFGQTLGVAAADSIVTNTLVGLACGFVSNNLKYYLPKKERYWYITAISLGLSGLILLLCKRHPRAGPQPSRHRLLPAFLFQVMARKVRHHLFADRLHDHPQRIVL